MTKKEEGYRPEEKEKEGNLEFDRKKKRSMPDRGAEKSDSYTGAENPGQKSKSSVKPSAKSSAKAGKNTGRPRRKKRAVRRKETPFQKYFQKVGGAFAFILLILSTCLTGRSVLSARETSGMNAPAVSAAAAENAPGTDAETAQTAEAVTGQIAAVQTGVTATPVPTVGPGALPIPENVPEQDAAAFFANGISTVDGQGVTILGGGDNLIHEPIYTKARTDNGYSFDYLYANVKSFIQSADIATINQEAPLATNISDPSGYPLFNTPQEVGQSLFNTGFDVINIGNNHIFDQGNEGAMATEMYFRNRGIPVVGLYKNEEDCHLMRIIKHNGINVAFLSFVEMTNEDPDEDEEGFVVYMEQRDRVRGLIEEAKRQADIVAVHAHWGEEGTTELTDEQVEMAHLMVDWGADIIFGNHSHVIQQLTLIKRESDSQLCPVIYSMGNFVSAQTHRNQVVSAMLAVKVTKDANGIARPSAMGVMPVITHFAQSDRMDIVLYPMAAYTEELARSHEANHYDGEFTMEYINSLLHETIPDRYLNRMSSLAESE